MPSIGRFCVGRSLLIALAIVVHATAASAYSGVRLHWTAPGDDGLIGRATRYDVRYSLLPITSANFAAATAVTGLPTPPVGGKQDSVAVTGLMAGVSYYFAMKTADEANNWSAMSNVLLRPAIVLGVEGPGVPLALSAPWPNPTSSVTHFEYSLPASSDVSANVFDITGRHVSELAAGRRAAGRGEFVWNLRDDSGHAVRAGVYLVRTLIAGRTWTHRVVIET